jgi:hypothetical protein
MSGSGASGVILIRALRVTAASLALAGVLSACSACSASHAAKPTPTPAAPAPTSSSPTPTPSASPTMSTGATLALAAIYRFNAYFNQVVTDPSSYTAAALGEVAILPASSGVQSVVANLVQNHEAYRGSPARLTYRLIKDQSTTAKVPVVTFTGCAGASPLVLYNTRTNAVIRQTKPPTTAPYPWLATIQVVSYAPGRWVVATDTTDSTRTCTP